MTTDELDRIAHEFMFDHGAYPSTLGYRASRSRCCTSLNEVICHGIPDSHGVVEDGDIVNIDVTAYIDGVHGDTNATFLAGDVDEETPAARRAHPRGPRCAASRRSARAGAINVIGRVIESYAKRFGYGVVRDFTGHGIGTTFHNGLIVLHYDEPRYDDVIEPGMTFTIEPMINLGTLEYDMWDDGWTVVTKDRKWTRAVRAHPGGDRGRRRDPDHPLSQALHCSCGWAGRATAWILIRRGPRGRSGLHRAGWWLTATRGDPRDSATENRPPRRLRPAG